VAEFTLAPAPPLGGYAASFDGAALPEVSDLALVSIAVPLDGRDALAAALGAPLPEAGGTAAFGGGRLLGLAADQAFALLPLDGAGGLAERVGGAGYCTDQTGGWVMLRLTGPDALAALERICPLDLHPDRFPEGRVARTVMEHLGAVLLREGPDAFLLMSASSSARSFLHAVETSIRNVALR
jgi:sarcosine oxidase subunit gamma